MDLTRFADWLRDRQDLESMHPRFPTQTFVGFVEHPEHGYTISGMIRVEGPISPPDVLGATAGFFHPADEVVVLLRATVCHMDDADDIELSPAVLELTNRTHPGWMVWGVTLTGVDHAHLAADTGELFEFDHTLDDRFAELDRNFIGLIAHEPEGPTS